MFTRSLLFVLLTSLFYNAQAQVTFGLFAGPQKTTAIYSIRHVHQPTEYKQGFGAGVTLKVPFENQLYFSPTINYSMKGYKVQFNQPSLVPSDEAVNNNTTIHTVEVTPMFLFDFSKKPSHFFLKAGPSLDVNISGHEQFTTNTNKEVSQKMTFSFENYGYVTALAVAHLGFETGNGFIFFAHYAQGLASLNNYDGGPQIRHRVFGISIGKYFYKNPNVLNTKPIR